MTTEQHYSPGPWTRRFNGASVIIDDANGKAVARALPRIRGELNGDVIAAAPELLAALERLAHPMADDGDLDYAKEIIAKAKGGAL